MVADIVLPKGMTPYDYEKLTVSTTVKTLTQSKWLQRGSEATRDLGNARAVLITVETDAISVRFDGTDPTAAEGHQLAVGKSLLLTSEQQFKLFKMIRVTTDATVKVSYLR